ncbi:MAG: radical SAM protein [Nitrospirae bacterium]|nr:radical SAM protein [Nitrospirota bacterium]
MSITNAQDFFIQWHLTERCNLRCRHCYQTGGRTDELSFDEIREVISEVSDMLRAWADSFDMEFSPSFNITGGEPFLREDIFEIMGELDRMGFAIYLLSNGTLIDRHKARKLAILGIKGVQISIEGPEDVHDMIRGKGSFSASIRGVNHLLEAGLTVTLNATLSDLNAGDFPAMISLASSIGVQRLGFSRLVPSGRGAGLLNKMISKARVKDIYETIFSREVKGLEIVTGDPVASQMKSLPPEEDSGEIARAGCAAGISGLTFLPDGTIVPCRRLFVPLGNVRKDSLREVWAGSGVLEMLRDRKRYKGKCSTCSRWADCRGCRAIAYAYAQSRGDDDFLAEDPQCFIQD